LDEEIHMQFTTLLPPAAAHAGTRRSHLLIDADRPSDARYQVSASTYVAGLDDEPVLQVRVKAGAGWAIFGLDGEGVLRAAAWGRTFAQALERWADPMMSFGLAPLRETYAMLPPRDTHAGPRRSSLLLDHDDPDRAGNQLSAKRLNTSDGELLQLRIWTAGCWTQVVLDDALGFAAFAAADTEKAAWKAAQAGLRARGWTL